jgi:hypothetical protein
LMYKQSKGWWHPCDDTILTFALYLQAFICIRKLRAVRIRNRTITYLAKWLYHCPPLNYAPPLNNQMGLSWHAPCGHPMYIKDYVVVQSCHGEGEVPCNHVKRIALQGAWPSVRGCHGGLHGGVQWAVEIISGGKRHGDLL